jgi:hypothetical protein
MSWVLVEKAAPVRIGAPPAYGLSWYVALIAVIADDPRGQEE